MNVKYQDNRNRMWLGVSVEAQQEDPHKVLVCGHRWKNARFRDSLFINGVCYLLDEDLHESSSQKLLPLIGTLDEQQNYNLGYLRALGLAGASFTFTEDSKHLLLGAPGLFSWRGSVILYDFKRSGLGNARVLNALSQVQHDSYYGYSVTSGTFFEKQETTFAVGSPRDNGYTGAVYFLEIRGPDQHLNSKILGTTLGSYYGSVVSAVKLTRGKYSSLLVGAPLYSTDSGGDEGQVHVYTSDGKIIREQNVILRGGSIPGARFGSAISGLGDINQDSFEDVAIGAPYEDSGRGAVYIYHGGPAGIRCLPATQVCKAAQVIQASARNWPVTGFGSSLSRPMDVDNNGTPDLIIGSYSSDKAVILRSSYVIGISLNLNTSVVGLDRAGNTSAQGSCKFNGRNAFCFNISACAVISGTSSDPVDFTMILELDPSDSNNVRQIRRYYMNLSPRSRMTRNLSLTIDIEKCFEVGVLMPYDDSEDQDFDTPVSISLEAAEITPKRIDFCTQCSVLNPENETRVTTKIPFITGCGKEDRCVPDLDVQAAIIGLKESDILVSGANRTLTLEVRVESRRDPAYMSVLKVFLPEYVDVVNQANCHIRSTKSENQATSLRCRLGDPFRNTEFKDYRFVLDISKLPIKQRHNEIIVEASSKDMEENMANNGQRISLDFEPESTIKITGSADKGSYFYGMDYKNLSTVHKYYVESSGPSPVDVVKLLVTLPVRDRVTGQRFLTPHDIQILGLSSESGMQSYCNVSSEGELHNITLHLTGKKEGEESSYPVGYGDSQPTGHRSDVPFDLDLRPISSRPRTDEGTSFFEINCESVECETIECFLRPFPSHRKVALVVIPAEVNLTVINRITGDAENVTFMSLGMAEAFDYTLFPDSRDSTQVFIQLVQLISPGDLPVASWVIAVSTGAGFLLLCLLILGLVQLGFFHRKKHEELKKLMSVGQVVNPSMEPDSVLEEDQNDHELPDMTDNSFPDMTDNPFPDIEDD